MLTSSIATSAAPRDGVAADDARKPGGVPSLHPRLRGIDTSSSFHAQAMESNPLLPAVPSVFHAEQEAALQSISKPSFGAASRLQRRGDVVGVSEPDVILPGEALLPSCTARTYPHSSEADHDGAEQPASTCVKLCACAATAAGDGAVEAEEQQQACASPPTRTPRGETRVVTIASQDDLLTTSTNLRRKRSCGSQQTVSGEEDVLHNVVEEEPKDPVVRKTLRLLRRKNCVLMAALLTIIIVLAVAGGLSIGFVNRYFATMTQRMYLESSDRVILNSSVLLLKNYQEALQADAQNLMTFVRSTMLGMTASNVTKLQSALYVPFFDAWRTWLFSSNVTAMHSIYVPMCKESLINTIECPIMALSISCLPNGSKQSCTYMRSDEVDNTRLIVNMIDFDETGAPQIGSFYKYMPLEVNYQRNQTDYKHGYFLNPGYGTMFDGTMHATLTMRRQEVMNGLVVICDSGTFLDRWFSKFEKGLQKTEDSYSMLFRDNGTILAYGYGEGRSSQPRRQQPCYAWGGTDGTGPCGQGRGGVLDRMVDIFKGALKNTNVLNEDVLSNGQFSLTKRMDNYVVVYQDFLRFRTDYAMPNIVFFAAYAVPLDTSLGRDGIVQIVICVVIIIICMFLLGGVALVAVNQMMRVVEVISQLSTHAATYDTKQMRTVLDRQKPGLLVRTITSADIINHEFQRILTNLNAYRPFLPQSLLTKGNYSFSDESQERPSLVRHHDVSLGGDAASDFFDNDEDTALDIPPPLPHLNNALEHIIANPIENSRLLQRGFHRTKSTILVVKLVNVALDPGDSVEVVNAFVQAVLNHASSANGVVEAIEFQKVVVSFNSHFPVPRHQEKACLCALAMRDAFRDSGCRVCVGIASGYNYVGTTGTEQQKARVIMGESVVVAQALTSLNNLLGCSIYATDPVVFEALVTAVAVDVVQIYNAHNNQWVQYGVSEIVGNRHAVLSPDMQLVKAVFKLVRYRQAEEALEMIRGYVESAAERREVPSWSVRRLHALVENQQPLIKSGYRRQRRNWQMLESDEMVMNNMSEVNRCPSRRQQQQQKQQHPQRHHQLQLLPENALKALVSPTVDTSLAAVSASGQTVSGEFTLIPSDTLNRGSEAALARALVGERSRQLLTRRHVKPVGDSCLSEEALFPVFVLRHDDDEEDEEEDEGDTASAYGGGGGGGAGSAAGAGAAAPCSARGCGVSSMPPGGVDVGGGSARSEEMMPMHMVNGRTLPSTERDALRARPPALVSIEPPSSASPPPPQPPQVFLSHGSTEFVRSTPGIASILSTSRRHSAPDRHRHPVPSPPHSAVAAPPFRVNALAMSGALGSGGGGGSGGPSGTLVAPTSGVADVGRPTAESALRPSSGSGAAAARAYLDYELPQRIVSVHGQLFYRTTQLVGRGSFGEVYLVISETGSLGAMKAFPLNDSNAPQLIREVETLSQMRHENIVGYDCCAVHDNYFFIICEYMAAGTLGSLIQRLGVVPELVARKYARDMLFGLGYLHQHSWLHCDIKPENILMASDGTCKLADFGAASLGRSLMDALTVRGTPRFSAPEAILGTWSKQADIFSFGITVAQMVTGVHPWHIYTEPDHLFVAHYAGEIRHSLQTKTPCAMQPDLPTHLADKELQSAIHRCCAFDPAQRPTVEELVTLLS